MGLAEDAFDEPEIDHGPPQGVESGIIHACWCVEPHEPETVADLSETERVIWQLARGHPFVLAKHIVFHDPASHVPEARSRHRAPPDVAQEPVEAEATHAPDSDEIPVIFEPRCETGRSESGRQEQEDEEHGWYDRIP